MIVRLFAILTLVTILLAGAADAQSLNARAEQLLEDQLSGEGRIVEIDGFSGVISTTARMERLTVADRGGVWLVLENAVLDWSASELFERRLRIEELRAERLEVLRAPIAPESDLPTPQSSGFRIPELPLSIRIGTLSIPEIVLAAPLLGEDVIASLEASAMLEAGALDVDLALVRRNGAGGAARVTAAFTQGGASLDVNADISEPAGGVVVRALNVPELPSIKLQVTGSGPLDDFTANIDLSTNGAQRLGGTVTIAQAGITGRRFEADIGGDIRPLLTEENRAFFGSDTELTTRGLAQPSGALSLETLAIRSAKLSLQGNAEIAAGGSPSAFELTGQMSGALPGSDVILDLARLRASYDAARGPDWDLLATVTGAQMPGALIEGLTLTGRGVIAPDSDVPFRGDVTLLATGIALDDADLAQAIGPQLAMRTALSVRSNGNVTLGDLNAETQHATLTGQASALPGDGRLALSATLTATLPDLGAIGTAIAPLTAGRAVARMDVRTALPGGDIEVELVGKTEGLDAGLPILNPVLEPENKLELSVLRDQTGTTLRSLSLRNPEMALALRGAVDDTSVKLNIDSDLKDISQFHARLPSTAVKLSAAVDGPLTAPRLRLVGKDGLGTNLQLNAEQKNRSIRFDSIFEAPTLAPFAALLEPLRAGRVGAEVDGTFNLDTQDLALVFVGDTAAFDIGIPQLSPLLEPQTRVETDLIRRGDGTIEIATATLRNPELSADATGTLSGEVPRLSGTARLRDVRRFVPSLAGAVTLRGAIDGDTVSAQVDSAAGVSGRVNGQIGQPGGAVDLRIDGAAPLGLAQPFLTNQVLTGQASFDLALRGVPSLTALSGRVTSDDLRLADPGLGVVLDQTRTTVTLGQSRAIVSLQGALNDAPMQVTGGMGLAAPFATDLSVALRDLGYVYEDLLRTRIDADLSLQGQAQTRLSIGGRVQLSGTEIRVPDGVGGAGAAIPDIRHQGARAPVRQTLTRAGLNRPKTSASDGPRLPLNVNVIATDSIFVRGRGLDAEFGGELQLGGTVANPEPVGRFDLRRGRLSLLGQRLDLTEGAITLVGSLIPRLLIVAASQTDDVTAQIRLEGPADAPDLTLTSLPELPQDEIIARLLFGKSVASLSAFQVARLISSLATLSSNRPGFLENTRMLFGVDDLDIRTDEATGQTQLAIGNYITENVYSEVELGGNGTSQINLNLDLNANTRLRGSVNAQGETGIGIFWEKDY